MVDAVSSALVNASYDKETKQQVLIQSDDTSVLSAFKKFPTFKRVLIIDSAISDASKPSLDEIKEFANAVTVMRGSIAQINGFFLTRFTDVVDRLHAANFTVYVGVLKNEFMNLGFDYWADPTIEIATYTSSVMVDGLMTEFPATATAYFSKYPLDTMNIEQFQIAATPKSLSAQELQKCLLKLVCNIASG